MKYYLISKSKSWNKRYVTKYRFIGNNIITYSLESKKQKILLPLIIARTLSKYKNIIRKNQSTIRYTIVANIED